VLRCGALLAAAALVALPLAAAPPAAAVTRPQPPVGSDAFDRSLTQAEALLQPILDQLHTSYQRAEVETQAYDALDEKLTAARAEDQSLLAEVRLSQDQVDDGLSVAGAIADAEYRDGGNLTQLGELLGSADPQQALYTEQLLQMAGRSQASFLRQLTRDQQDLVADRSSAAAAEQHADQLVQAVAAQRAVIDKQLTAVEQQVSTLTGAQRQELSLLEQKEADAAQLAFLASGILGKDDGTPSAAGAKAIAFAFAQLGAPYVWGGIGPYAQGFDCSGLTSQAWLSAGVPIPRTSEQQWADLPQVPLDQLRPGDLIIYFADASHVAMYIGDGEVIESPHPGAFVDVEPIAEDPILGAVRPDAGDASLGSYTAPTVPPSAKRPPPIAPIVVPTPTPKPTPKPSPKPKPSPTGSPKTGPTTPPPSGSPSSSPSAPPSTSPSAPTPPSPSTTPSVSVSASEPESASASPSSASAPSAPPSGQASATP
jgi:cell wall-associated NlpC family hydrolase